MNLDTPATDGFRGLLNLATYTSSSRSLPCPALTHVTNEGGAACNDQVPPTDVKLSTLQVRSQELRYVKYTQLYTVPTDYSDPLFTRISPYSLVAINVL